MGRGVRPSIAIALTGAVGFSRVQAVRFSLLAIRAIPPLSGIGDHFGPIDLAMIPIGAYEPRSLMKSVHLNPADAVHVHLDIKSSLSVACHWGTYRLTDEPVDEPPRLLRRQLELRNIDPAQFRILQPGETLEV
jgi:N-acyl-phosphatidylethanolamine-hydrolysing phospholipase D